MKLRTFQTTEDLIFQCLETFRQIFPTLGKNDGIMLAGGRTPLEIYRRAAKDGLSTNGQLFLSDERYVPITDPQSNYGTILPMFGNLMRIQTELPIEAAAQAFHDDLSRLDRIPLGLLGLGADGHTASLFNLQDAKPGSGLDFCVILKSQGLTPSSALAIPVKKAKKPDRISVTPMLLHKVEKILILATGADKKEMIQTLLEKPETIPAGVALAGHPNVEIWTDQSM